MQPATQFLPGVITLDPRRSPATIVGDEAHDARLAAAGDAAAFERLYRRNSGRIYGLATRMVGFDEAGECTQEVFVRAWEKLGGFRGDAAFGTWLYRLAINTILSYRAKRGRRQEKVVEVEDGILELHAAPIRRSEDKLDLESAIRSLPDRARDVFVLHDVEGFRHEEIGDMLSINIGTSKSQLHRARMLLRGKMTR